MFLQSLKYHIKQKNLLHQDMHTLKNREFSVGQIFAAFLRHLQWPSEKKIEPVVCRPLPGTRRNSFIKCCIHIQLSLNGHLCKKNSSLEPTANESK